MPMFHAISRRVRPRRSWQDDHARGAGMPTFTVHALPEDVAADARRSPGAVPALAGDGSYPVRCCLRDADDAAGVVLTSVMPFRGESPYAARSPVYVHAERCEGHTAERGAVPAMLRGRLLSVRAYDGSH